MTAASLTLDLVADADVPTLTSNSYERPTRINIANAEETLQRSSSRDSSTMQQLASPTTPTSATLSPSGSAIMSPTSSSFLPEMPQWKKDLIQRRKTNAARSTAAGAGVGGANSPLLSPQQQQLFRAGHESDGSHSPTKDFSTLKSMQYTTAKASQKTIKTTTTTITNQTTSQQQQQHFLIQHQQQQQHITAEEQQLQQQKIAKPNVIKTPATQTAISEEKQQQQQQQQNEEDVDPVISPTTKEEIAEKFIGGHSTPQVSMDPSTAAEVETSSTPHNAAAPIPKQRSLFVAPIKLLSTEEPDSCTTNSSATATSATRLTSSSSSSSPTTTMVAAITKEQQQQLKQQKNIKGKVEKVEPATDAELHEAVKEEELVAETTTTIITTTTATGNQQHIHSIKNICGTYSSLPSTTSTATPPPTPTAIVGKSTTGTITGLGSSCGSSHNQSYSSNESEKSCEATTTFGTSALLSTTSKKFDIDKFEKSSPKISTKLQSNQFIKNQAVSNNIGAAAAGGGGGGATSKYIKYRATQESNDCSPTTTKTTANAAIIKKKMVAVQEMKKTTTNTNHHISTTTTTCSRQAQAHTADFDASEDLSYGPGIVSKLRCRYLSLALRESMEKQRHALDTLRRATSLNNLLDRDDQLRKHAEDDEEDEEEEDENVNGGDGNEINIADDYGEDQENLPPRPATGGILRGPHDSQQNVTKKTATFQKYASAANAHARMSQSQGDGGVSSGDNNINNKRSRHIKRGNDSLKRARSVEALLCEKSPWNFAYNRSSLEPPKQQPLPTFNRTGAAINVTIEDKINNARERLVLGTDVMPPRRLTSIIDDTERPPPDLVKQTLKKFEATANRRGRGVNRAQGNGEVANKVANYRSIIKEQKPAIVFPKPPAPPLSPTKKVSVKLVVKAPVLGAADLIGSPIGRKTAAVAATTTTPTVGSPLSGGFPPHVAETSTPKQKLNPVPADVLAFTSSSTPPLKNVTALSGGSVGIAGLSENSPDIIPRHNNINKILSETAAGAGVVVDSPVTALTKKLEKLRIDADKQAYQQQQQQHVTAKEFQAKPNQQQQEQQHDLNAGSDKFVGGDAAALAADKHHNSNGTRSKNNKNKIISDNDKNTNDDDGGDDSDVHDDYDFVHDRCAEAESVKAGTGSASSDLSDDEYGTVTTTSTTKRVSKKALDNIAKAGTSQEFKFSTTTTTTELLKTTATGKQIGVIRPLHQLPASNSSSSSSSSSSTFSTYSSSNSSNESFINAKSSTNNNNQHQPQQQQQQHMETLRNHHQQQTYTLSHTSNTHTHAHHHQQHHPALTSREIEKNRINEMKKTATVAATATTVAAATDTATAASITTTATTSLDTVIVTGGSSSSSSSKVSSLSELDAAATITHNSSPLWALQTKKKRQPPAVVAENNSMVFNFSNRKEVPDYIENDGVVIRRKRELPKPNESGFVLLGDLSLETSTDSDYDDFSLCPPSPCDVEFENANIVIDGKSSIRQKPKEASFRVQFNDTLTSTFEYPSEASLVVDDSISDRYANENFVNSYENLVLEPAVSITQTDSPKHHHHHVAVDEIIPIPINTTTVTTNNSTPTTKMLGSLPLGSAPLGCYTPIKAPIDNLFQLGVTRAPNGNGISHNTTTTTTNGNGTTAAPTTNGDNNGDSNDGNILPTTPTTNDEPESLQYLKPANDDLTIAYSEGAQKTDLLY